MMKIENPVETLLGAVVIVTAIGFAIYAGRSGDIGVSGDTYPLVASFSSASGVSPGTEVRIAGVRVGAVSSVVLDAETYRATTTMAIRSDVELPEDTIAKVDAEGLLGGTFVALAPGAGFDMLSPGDEIENTQGAISLGGLISQVVGASGGGQ